MEGKRNEKTPQVELKPPRDDEKWWSCRQRLVNVFFVPVTSKILWECILFLQQLLKSLENLSWKQNVRILLEYFLNWSFPDRNGSLGASSLLLLLANPIVGGVGQNNWSSWKAIIEGTVILWRLYWDDIRAGGKWKESKMLVNLKIPLFLLKSCATLQTANSIDFAPWV